MFPVSKSEISKIIPLICAVLVVAVGAFFVGQNATSHMLRASVEANARSWGDYIVKSVPQLEFVLDGTAPIEVAAAFFRGKEQAGSIRLYRIYDQFGFERVDSSELRLVSGEPGAKSSRSTVAFDVLATSNNHFEFYLENDGENEAHFASAFVPLVKEGRTIGVLEVYSDETGSWAILQSQFGLVALQILGLIFVAFMLPGFLYLRRSGQLEFAASRLRHTAEYDELTGALNRSAFTAMMQSQIENADQTGLSVAVHFIDLDRFKDVNDTRGHAVGDEVLSQVAVRLRRLLGTRERLARLGGDEFAICQPYFRSSQEVVSELANDIVKEIAKPFFVDGAELSIGASVGYSYYPRDGKTIGELVRAADIALYSAKDAKRGTAVAFDRSMESARKARQKIEDLLRRALSEQRFVLNYQPLYCLDGKGLRGFEALLRLSDDDGQPVSPVVFIPIAEEMGLIGDIGAWVLEAASRTAMEWPEDLTVSVNLSPAQFQSHDMPRVVADTLARTGLSPHRLELEVTESLLIADTDKVLEDLRAIKALGVSIALDDFGTGYSSLSYLWLFPFDKLKVDKSFMTDLAVAGSKSREILSTIIALGRILGLKITAEGVETEEQSAVLRELDCDLVQGFLYGRPMANADLPPVLMRAVEAQVERKRLSGPDRRVKKKAG